MPFPGPHPGRYPAHPHPGQALARPFGMSMENPIFAHNSFSRTDRSFYQNPYESGNENRRRNVRRVRAEKAQQHMRPQHHFHGGMPGLGGYGLGGARPDMHPGIYDLHAMRNPNQPGMLPGRLGMRLSLPRLPYRPGPRARFPAYNNPYGLRHRGNTNARRPPHPIFTRGYQPRPTPRHPSYSDSLFGEEEDDDDDDFDLPSRTPRSWRDRFDDLDEDNDDDDDLLSTSTTRPFRHYNRGPARRYYNEWDDDEDEGDDEEGDEFGTDLGFGMGSHRGPYRHGRYYSY